MDRKTDILGLLDLMTRPGFCVKDNQIIKVNPAASGLLIEGETDVLQLIQTGLEEYNCLGDGCLCLTLSLPGGSRDAAVTKMGEYLVFLLEPESDDPVFNAMALVSKELRKPLSNVMLMADQLLELDNPEITAPCAQLNQGLYQLLRIVGNLSFPVSGMGAQSVLEVGGIVAEVCEKAQTMLESKGIHVSYSGLKQDVYCLLDPELLERALWNLFSNAAKFTPAGGNITVSLQRSGSRLLLQVRDTGSGIAEQVRQDLFYRYLREPGIEDSRFGLGLGMMLIRSCASRHSGTVLVDQPEGGGSRITLTIAIRQTGQDRFHSPINLRVDYTGGRDHALVELSDCLNADCYDNTK